MTIFNTRAYKNMRNCSHSITKRLFLLRGDPVLVSRRSFAQFIRVLSVVFAGLYVVFFYDLFYSSAFEGRSHIKTNLAAYSISGVICNFGLFFITTDWARKMRLLTTLFYIPVLFITPIIVAVFSNDIGGCFFFLLFIFVYFYFNPWRKI